MVEADDQRGRPNDVARAVAGTDAATEARSETDLTASVVVPTYNRVERLGRVLTALADQTVDPATFEVIVVSDGSTDGTIDYLRSDDVPIDVVAIDQPNSGPAAARNRGIAKASSALIIFLDDDVVPAADFVAEHVASHARQPNSVVIGPMLTPTDHAMPPWVSWEQTMLYKQYSAMSAGEYEATARQFYTGNVSLQRARLVECGGFDERFRRAEDVELGFRLGETDLSFVYNEQARGFHYAERTLDAWCEIARTYGANDIIFAREPGREWIGEFLVWAFERHHPVVRTATRAAVASSRVERVQIAGLRRLVRVAAKLPWEAPARAALSIMYSTLYHCGARDELGGAESFATLLSTGTIDPTASRRPA